MLEKFESKIFSLEESKDLTSMSLTELSMICKLFSIEESSRKKTTKGAFFPEKKKKLQKKWKKDAN